MSKSETPDPFISPEREYKHLLGDELEAAWLSSGDTQSLAERWRTAEEAVQIRLQNALFTYMRLKAGEDVPESEIDYPALSVVSNIAMGMMEGREN